MREVMFKRLQIFFLGLVLSLFIVTYASAVTPVNYSADIESASPMGAFTSRFYAKDGKQRMEMASGGMEAVTILRSDKKVIWMLMPRDKSYMEMPMSMQKNDIPPLNDPDVKVEKDFLGDDKVDGHGTKKYHVNIIRGGKKEASGFLWEAPDLENFPVKFQNDDKTITITWKNIRLNGATDQIFEIPAGYRKMDLPTGAPGGANGVKTPGR